MLNSTQKPVQYRDAERLHADRGGGGVTAADGDEAVGEAPSLFRCCRWDDLAVG